MNPYREPSPRLEHWDVPQPGDLVRFMGSRAHGDVLERSGFGCLVFVDWYSDVFDDEDLMVVERRSAQRTGKSQEET